MIFVTGDTHSDVIDRFGNLIYYNNIPYKKLTKNDYFIICGDFGCVWRGGTRDRIKLDWLEDQPFTTLFVDGNHENYSFLKILNVEEWNGGLVQKLRPSVIHLMRGEVYEIDGHKIFAMGGAASHDVQDGILDMSDRNFADKKKELDATGKYLYRIKDLSWWEEENISDDDMENALYNLSRYDYKVDYIFSHAAPTTVAFDMLREIGCYTDITDKNTGKLDTIYNTLKDFKGWFFGHYHRNKWCGIPTDEGLDKRFVGLYGGIIGLDQYENVRENIDKYKEDLFNNEENDTEEVKNFRKVYYDFLQELSW